MQRLMLVMTVTVLTACGGSRDTPPGSGAADRSGRPNLIISVTGEALEGRNCMLRIAAENRQARRVTVMVELDARAPGAELSSPTITAAFGVPEKGSGQYPDYSFSGAPCAELTLQVRSLMCVGADRCVAQYRSSGIAGLLPPQE